MTEQLVSVARTHLPWEAALMQNILRGHGVGCVLGNEHTSALGAPYAVFSGGIEVLVPEDQLEAAQRVLEQAASDELEAGDWAVDDAAPEPDPVEEEAWRTEACPNCGSGDIAEVHEPQLPRVLRFFMTPFFGASKPAWYCRACDWYWKDEA